MEIENWEIEKVQINLDNTEEEKVTVKLTS